jgi:hypothetical protein
MVVRRWRNNGPRPRRACGVGSKAAPGRALAGVPRTPDPTGDRRVGEKRGILASCISHSKGYKIGNLTSIR